MTKITSVHLVSDDQPLEKLQILNESIEASLLNYYNAQKIDTYYVTISEFFNLNFKACNILHLNFIRTDDNNLKYFFNKQNVIKLNRFLLKNKNNILVLGELLDTINHVPAIKTFFPTELFNQINFLTSNISIDSEDIKLIKSLLILPYTKLFLNENIQESNLKKDFFIPANTIRSSKFIVLHLLKHANILENNFYSYIDIKSDLTKEHILTMYKDSTEIKLLEETFKHKIKNRTIGNLYDENSYVKNKYFNLNFDKDFLQELNQSMIVIVLEDKAFNDIKIDKFNTLSEKFFLPIIMKKPFIVFYCKNFLKEMKQFGFKSFSPFINEKYDVVEDDILRYQLAIEEMKKISEFNDNEKKEFLKNVLPICEHNYNIMSEYLYNKNFLK